MTTHPHIGRFLPRIAASIAVLAAVARADDVITNVMSPLVSYLTVDVNTNIISPPVSYLSLDWLGDSNVTFHAAPVVSYFYQIGNGTGTALFAIQGTVTDPTGAGIPGATVKASISQSVIAQTATDSGGQYALPALGAGVYVLRVSEATHASAARALTLNANTAQQNFQLAILPSVPTVGQTNRQPAVTFAQPPPGPRGSTLRVFDGSAFVPITAGNAPSANLMTIVMTHGWVRGSPDPAITNTAFDLWPSQMAALMRNNGITAGIANIVAWDWRYAAENPPPVPSRAVERVTEQGEALGQALTSALGANYTKNLHFIGHSLGTLVNASAVNYLYGIRTGNSRQEVSPTPWLNAQIHVTLLDQAELAELLGDTTIQNDSDSTALDAFNHADPPAWQSPLPVRFTWADNYKSLVSLSTLSRAVNVELQKNPWLSDVVAAHGYPVDWYNMSVTNRFDAANPLGFAQSYEFDLSIGLPSSVFPPSTFQAGTLFKQSSDSDPLALALDFTSQQWLTIGADSVVQGVNGTIHVVGNVTATVVSEAQSAGQAIQQGFDNTVNAAQQGAQAVVNVYNSGVLGIILTTGLWNPLGPLSQRGTLQTLDVGNPTNTAAMAWVPIQIPPNAQAMVFDFGLSGDPVDDVMVCGINDTNLFSLSAKYIPTNTISASRLLDVSQWSGQQVELFFGLMGGTSSNATLSVDNIRFYSLQPPQLSIDFDGNNTTLSWPSNVGGGMVESATSLLSTNWDPITNAPVLSPTSYMVTNIWSDPIRFFRLRLQ